MSGATATGLIIGVVIAVIVLFLILFMKAAEKKTELTTSRPETTTEGSTSEKSDDLTVIEGIGPKISSLLKEKGVAKYKDLAKMDPAEIAIILNHAGLRLADASTWPEQAGLLAEGKLEELKSLQAKLKGGRRV